MNAERSARPEKPLEGWRVLVPRGGSWGEGIAASLRAEGAVPVVAPLINFAPVSDAALLAQSIADLEAGMFDWLTITSIAQRPWTLSCRASCRASAAHNSTSSRFHGPLTRVSSSRSSIASISGK